MVQGLAKGKGKDQTTRVECSYIHTNKMAYLHVFSKKLRLQPDSRAHITLLCSYEKIGATKSFINTRLHIKKLFLMVYT